MDDGLRPLGRVRFGWATGTWRVLVNVSEDGGIEFYLLLRLWFRV